MPWFWIFWPPIPNQFILMYQTVQLKKTALFFMICLGFFTENFSMGI